MEARRGSGRVAGAPPHIVRSAAGGAPCVVRRGDECAGSLLGPGPRVEGGPAVRSPRGAGTMAGRQSGPGHPVPANDRAGSPPRTGVGDGCRWACRPRGLRDAAPAAWLDGYRARGSPGHADDRVRWSPRQSATDGNMSPGGSLDPRRGVAAGGTAVRAPLHTVRPPARTVEPVHRDETSGRPPGAGGSVPGAQPRRRRLRAQAARSPSAPSSSARARTSSSRWT